HAVRAPSDLKSTTDDAVAAILSSPKLPAAQRLTATHTKSDVHLLLGYAAVAIGAVSFWADRKYDFHTTYPYIAIAVCVYFALNLALTGWVWLVEKGCIFEGVNAEGDKIEVFSYAQRHSPRYQLRVKCVSKGGEVLQDQVAEKEFNEWFSCDGVLQRESLQAWLVSAIVSMGGSDGGKSTPCTDVTTQ
ncbi:hypothetical protein KEM52_001321, partial [Ascosphaera acerosa]